MAKSSLVFYLFFLQHISCTNYLNYVRDTVIIIKTVSLQILLLTSDSDSIGDNKLHMIFSENLLHYKNCSIGFNVPLYNNVKTSLSVGG